MKTLADRSGAIRLAALGASLALLLVPGTSAGQVEKVLDFRPCERCTIEKSADAVLGVEEQIATVVRMSDGRLAVVLAYDRFQFAVLDSAGAVLQHFGRLGEGPGEYADVTWLEAEGDFVHVVDGPRRQVTVLDAGRDFGVLRTVPLPGASGRDMAVLGDSAYVANLMIFTPERMGYALHLLDGAGNVLQSFDEPGGPVRGMGAAQLRWVRAGLDGTVWSAPMTRYRIDQWDPVAGKRLRSLVRRADWFPDHEGFGPLQPDRPRLPVVVGVDPDSAGYVWVMTNVAVADRWTESLVKVEERAHPEMPEYELPADQSIAFDTVVEVIDPATGRIVAARTFDERLYGLQGGRAFTTSPGDAPFTYRHQMWRLRLVIPEGTGR